MIRTTASLPSHRAEWLETDGLGGYAMGTAGLCRTRRYHGLLIADGPRGRTMLLNGFDAEVRTERGTFSITSQHYLPDVIHPDGARRVVRYEPLPWPRWIFDLDGALLAQEIFMAERAVAITWRIIEGPREATLILRPLISGRDHHALHRENPSFDFAVRDGLLCPYPDLRLYLRSSGRWTPRREWYRRFLYLDEGERGLDSIEDLACPGELEMDLSEEAHLIASVAPSPELEVLRKRRSPRDAGDAYLVRRQGRRTIIAGYPWFTDWGRDTFISLRGLCLATGRIEDALDILRAWSPLVSEGMLPNRFPESGEPEHNSVDAALWYAVAVFETLLHPIDERDRRLFVEALEQIIEGYRSTRHGIRLDQDGLLAAGEPGVQLTWMDAKAGDWVVTPRVGKPVEIQALWLNALAIARELTGKQRYAEMHARGVASFRARFWGEHHLHDVVDVDHRPGVVDASLRPNQIFAVGGLPFALLEGEEARRVVDAVEDRLLTPVGLRTLDPSHPDYRGSHVGDVLARDAAYHQGTVWPWLLGPFVEAWVRVRGGTAEAKAIARERFLAPLLAHANAGHLFEIADGDAPHAPRGCPFQAWSLAEALRLSESVLK